MQPNRFELAPNQTQTVKFYLNAEIAAKYDEGFTVEGCSTSFPVRETIVESRLTANLIRPSLGVSQSHLTLKCLISDDHKEQSFQITNKSDLPLPVTLKVEGGFFVVLKESKTFEKKEKFELKVKESRNIFISFDRSLIKGSTSANSFEGKVKAFSFGTLQAIVEVSAEVIYPKVDISNCNINVVNNFLPRAINFTITNSGEVDSTFGLCLKEASTVATKIEEKKQENLMNIIQCMTKQKSGLKQIFLKDDTNEDYTDERDYDEEFDDVGNRKEFDIGDLHELVDVKLDGDEHNERNAKGKKVSTLVVEKDEEVALSEIQKHFKSLTRAFSEVLCSREGTYELGASKSKTSSEKPEESTEKYLRLSQTKGTMKPHESRLISIYFVGSKEGKLSFRFRFNFDSILLSCSFQPFHNHLMPSRGWSKS